jgi:glutaryl-CoA dehydrogenase
LGQSNPQVALYLADVARLMLAADMLGASSKMLEEAVNFANLRQQFGRPIGAFQAVKHLCAEMVAELEPARSLVWYSGYALDEKLPDATLACLHAKSYMAEASRLVSRSATEVHGGMGITGEYSIMRHMMNLESVITYEGTHDIHLLITGMDITGLNAFK